MSDAERKTFLAQLESLSPDDVRWLSEQETSLLIALKAELVAGILAGHDGGSFDSDWADDPQDVIAANDRLDQEGFSVRISAGQIELGIEPPSEDEEH